MSGASPTWSAPLRDEFFDALAEDFNTPRALAAAFDWVREANRSAEPVGDADLREMLGVLALDNLLDVEAVEAPPEATALLSASARRPAPSATGPRPTASATSCAALGWEVRDGADRTRAAAA